MKVCSLYGQGFYYIPGTQTCIKLGGFFRTEVDVHAGGSFTPFFNGTNAFELRPGDNYTTRARVYLTADVREQTSYGTLRGYFAGGWNYTSNDAPTISLPGGAVAQTGGGTAFNAADNSNISFLRGFIQLGGFTFGKTASFYDFFNTSKYSLQTNFLYQDYGGVSVFTYGYTQQLGNGTAATIAFQDPSTFEHSIVDASAAAVGDAPFGAFAATGPTNSGNTNSGTLVPDIVGSLRVDQAWGGAQLAAILHDNRANAYLASANGLIAGSAYPSDKWGFAVSGGLELNLPWAKGDSFAIQSQYCVGESYSCYNNSGTRLADLAFSLRDNSHIGLAWLDDAYFANSAATPATGLQLPTVWNVWAAVQHYWVPEVRTSLYGGYVTYKANSSAVDENFCAPLNKGATIGGLTGSSAVSATGCADWAAWTIGSRTLWNPVPNLDVGVDVLYADLTKSAFSGATYTFTPAQSPTNRLTVDAAHVVAGILRVQYNFYP